MVQLALVVTADLRPDRVFGFRMFNESSSLRFDLYRRLRGRDPRELVPVSDGFWEARLRTGERRVFRWSDRIRFRSLVQPGRFTHASYGLAAELFRLQEALNDVTCNTAADAETAALVALVDARKNGRPAGRLELSGHCP
jgi:hypothetical protein